VNKPPIYFKGSEEHRRRLAEAINILIDGGTNAIGSFTATANTAVTTVTEPRCTEDAHIDLTPLTANAASGLAVTYISNRSNGSFDVTHGSNAGTDRSYTYTISRT
jgi:hypothetical protein